VGSSLDLIEGPFSRSVRCYLRTRHGSGNLKSPTSWSPELLPTCTGRYSHCHCHLGLGVSCQILSLLLLTLAMPYHSGRSQSCGTCTRIQILRDSRIYVFTRSRGYVCKCLLTILPQHWLKCRPVQRKAVTQERENAQKGQTMPDVIIQTAGARIRRGLGGGQHTTLMISITGRCRYYRFVIKQ
jgi:hypothetical protein